MNSPSPPSDCTITSNGSSAAKRRLSLRRVASTKDDPVIVPAVISKNPKVDQQKRREKAEIAEWFKLYLQSPGVFENWVKLRQNSSDFKDKFAAEADDEEKQ